MSLAGPVATMAAYLIGAVPFGYLMYRWGRGGDIRAEGSGNIGATNVMRTAGRAAGIATLALDAGKGALAVWVARWATGDAPWEAAAAFAAVLGHCYPVFLGFKGGKGIATGCGAYGLLAPLPMALSLGAFLVVVLATRMVSAGSILAAWALPVILFAGPSEPSTVVSATLAATLVTIRHEGNIRRILSGSENRHGK